MNYKISKNPLKNKFLKKQTFLRATLSYLNFQYNIDKNWLLLEASFFSKKMYFIVSFYIFIRTKCILAMIKFGKLIFINIF